MIYLHNPQDKGADIKDQVIGEPGQSKKYSLFRGETYGFEDSVAESLIRTFGVVDGEERQMTKGFLEIVEPKVGKVAEPVATSVNGKTIFKCSVCEYEHEKKIAVLGHINRTHQNAKDTEPTESPFKVQEGIKIVPPAEVERLRRQRQEVPSMRPKRSLIDLQPKGEEETGYRHGPALDKVGSGLNTSGDMARHFYGPGLQEDTEV